MVDKERSLGEFLRSRRSRLRPEELGVVSHGPRRVPGLRREELAQLAGVSVTYYTRLEQGQAVNASPQIIESIARALQLSEDERAHLHDLATPVPAKQRRPRRSGVTVRPGTRRLIDVVNLPAVLLGRRTEVLAWNTLAHRLLAGHYAADAPTRPTDRPNLTRMLFLDPHHRDLFPDWTTEAARAVASLRMVAGRYQDDRDMAELVGELTMCSPDFAALWSRHPVAACMCGTKRFHHPEVGELDLEFEALHVADDSGQRILMYCAEPGSASETALNLLATVPAALTAPSTDVFAEDAANAIAE